MYRFSYNDLTWKGEYLEPKRYTLEDGVQTPWGGDKTGQDMVRTGEDGRAVIRMPAFRGKISDAGYDQMACLYTRIPVYDDVRFCATVRVLCCPTGEERNGQEGFGLFFRDTVMPHPVNGYPYSNMAAAGFFGGKYSLLVREGITREEIGDVRHAVLPDDVTAEPRREETLRIVLEKKGTRLAAEILREGETVPARYETEAEEGIFSSVESDCMYLGFLAARGCGLDMDPDTVSVEYGSRKDTAPASDLFASPDGKETAEGTADDPLDLQNAIERCAAGQTVRVLPGRYSLTEDLIIPDGGSAGKKIVADNSSGDWAVLDFGGRGHGVCVDGNGWDISGLIAVRGLGFMIRGSNNRIRSCYAAFNRETGFLIRHPSNDAPREHWPAGNVIEDCVSCLNSDPSGQHADGFACKIAAGEGNRFVRCTAWMNSDDGFDLFSKNRAIGAVSLDACRSWLNGYSMRGGNCVRTRGNGNGFKLGGSGLAVNHEAAGCEAYGNAGSGFTSNSNPCMRLRNCESGNNGENYVFYYTNAGTQAVRNWENCIERDAPGFDPAAWLKEYLFSGKKTEEMFPADDDGTKLLEAMIRCHNDTVIRNTLKTVRTLYKEEPEKPGVLIMCSSFYGGGAERVASRLANGLSKRYRVTLLCIQDKGRTYPLDPEIRIIQMPFFHGTWDMVNGSRAVFAREVKRILGIRAAISFMYTMNRVNVESKGVETVICSERNNPQKRYPQRMQEIDEMYAAADHVVFQSEKVRGMFSENVQKHGSVIVNPVAVTCGRKGGSHRIVNVARLVPQKNQAMLIRAFAAFYRSHPGYTLSFYGTGELAQELRTLADSLGIGQAVQFHGQVWDVHAAIADAEIFALSSDYEGLSNALLECMMMGFPCISTRCEGSVDVIRQEENGILTQIGSEEEMRAALTRLADDAELRMRLGAQARETAKRFLPERVFAQWEDLLETFEKE